MAQVPTTFQGYVDMVDQAKKQGFDKRKLTELTDLWKFRMERQGKDPKQMFLSWQADSDAIERELRTTGPFVPPVEAAKRGLAEGAVRAEEQERFGKLAEVTEAQPAPATPTDEEKPGVIGRAVERFKAGAQDQLSEAARETKRTAKELETGEISGARGIFDSLVNIARFGLIPVEGALGVVAPAIEAGVGKVQEAAQAIQESPFGQQLDVEQAARQKEFLATPEGQAINEKVKDIAGFLQEHEREIEQGGTLAEFASLFIGGKAAQKPAGKLAGAIGEGVEAGVEKAGKVSGVAALEARKGFEQTLDIAKSRLPSVKKTIAEAKELAGRPIPFTPTVPFVGKTTALDKTFRAIKPRITKKQNLKTVKANMELANDVIVENGFVPTDVRSYADAIASSKKQVWDGIEKKLASAGGETKVNFSSIADQIRAKAASPALIRANPSAVKELNKFADTLTLQGKQPFSSVLEAEKVKQMLNNELAGLFGEIQLSRPLKEAKKLATREIGKQLDELLSTIPGEFAGLKKQYGALRSIEDDVIKRMIVFERQNPEGLFTGLGKLAGVGNIVKGILAASPSEAAKGVAQIATSVFIKRANDANLLVKKAFAGLAKKKPKKVKLEKKLPESDFIQRRPDFNKAGAAKSANLVDEAKKFKSAEEFIEAQGERVFRGVSGGEKTFMPSEKGAFKRLGFSIADNKKLAKDFGDKVLEGRLSSGAKIKDAGKISTLEDGFFEGLKAEGFDGVKFSSFSQSHGDFIEETLIFNTDVIKTKSQLTDIFNKAKGK